MEQKLVKVMPKAKKLNFYVIGILNSNWKVLISYFLINGVTSEDKANLVNTYLFQVHDKSAIVKLLIFDSAGQYLKSKLVISNFIFKDIF